jgi:hypothetical protein
MWSMAGDLRGRAERLREMAAEQERTQRHRAARALHRAAVKLLEAADAEEAAQRALLEAQEALGEATARALAASDQAHEAIDAARADEGPPAQAPVVKDADGSHQAR